MNCKNIVGYLSLVQIRKPEKPIINGGIISSLLAMAIHLRGTATSNFF